MSLSVKQNGNRTGKRKRHSANWKPGESGNANGRPRKGHTLTDLIEARLDKEAFVQRVIGLAMEGNMAAIKEIFERIDGKVTQSLAGPTDVPGKIVVQFVSPGDSSPNPRVTRK
jgi:hypothetical protein